MTRRFHETREPEPTTLVVPRESHSRVLRHQRRSEPVSAMANNWMNASFEVVGQHSGQRSDEGQRGVGGRAESTAVERVRPACRLQNCSATRRKINTPSMHLTRPLSFICNRIGDGKPPTCMSSSDWGTTLGSGRALMEIEELSSSGTQEMSYAH